MIRVFLGSLLVAVVLFVWGAFWFTGLGMLGGQFQGLNNEEAIAAAVTSGDPAPGTYFLPFPDMARMENDTEYAEDFDRRHREGPLMQIVYVKEGDDPMSPAVFAAGFVHFFVCALLAAGLTWLASPGLPGYFSRVLFVLGLGVFAAVLINLSDVIWFYHPPGFPLFRAGFVVTSWLWAGLLLGWIIRPRKA